MMMMRRKHADGFPQARVVVGKHAPAWATQKSAAATNQSGVSYVRASNYNTVAVLFGLWPLFAVAAMGIALLWTGTVYGTP